MKEDEYLTEEEKEKLEEMSDFEDDRGIALFKTLKETNSLLKEIASKEMPVMPEFPEIPEQKEVVFPDVQMVEVINQKDTVVNVNVPDVIVPPIQIPEINIPEQPAPIVNIDTDTLEEELKDINETLKDKPTKENPMPVVLVFNGEEYKPEAGKSGVGGFGGGSALIATEQNTANTVTAINNLATALGGGAVTTLLDDVTTANVTYVGKAPVGSATSSAVWQVFKLDESGTPTTLQAKYAGTGAFDQIYDNRSSLTYN